MNEERLKSALRAAEQNPTFLISIDAEGIPYIEQVSRVKKCDLDPFCLSATEWFSAFTLNNLRENKYVTLFTAAPRTARFYQLHGLIEEVKSRRELLDGLAEEERFSAAPQIQRELVIFVKEIFETPVRQPVPSGVSV